MPGAERFLLCRPRGGLSDSLSLIEICRQHCRRTGRTLIVDGVRSNFAPDFSRVFRTDSAVLSPSRRVMARLDTMTCAPPEVAGRLGSYESVIFTAEGMNHLEWRVPMETGSGAVLRVPLEHDHDEQVILVEAHGDGNGGERFLAECRLVPRIARRVRARLRVLPDGGASGGYVGLHVRNSDLRSHWRRFLRAQADDLAGTTVVVCSDDATVVRVAPSLLPASRVITPSAVPVTGGVPYQAPFVPRWRRRRLVEDALVDLLALAGADEVRSPAVVNRGDPSSSFTRLARAVGQSPGLRERLLSG